MPAWTRTPPRGWKAACASFGFDDDADAFGVKVVGEPVCALFAEPLLNLWPAREVLDDAGQLRQAEDAFTGQVAHVADADQRKQVMFADRPDRYGAGEDKLVIAFVVGEGCQVKRAWREQLGVGAGHAARGIAHALGIEGNAQRPYELLGR